MSLIDKYQKIDREFLENSPFSICGDGMIGWLTEKPTITAIIIYNILESVRLHHIEKLKAWDTTNPSGISDRLVTEFVYGTKHTLLSTKYISLISIDEGMVDINEQILYHIEGMKDDSHREMFIENIKSTTKSKVYLDQYGKPLDSIDNLLILLNYKITDIVKSYPYNSIDDGIFIYIVKKLLQTDEYKDVMELDRMIIIQDAHRITDIDIMLDMFNFYQSMNWRYIPDISVSCLVLEHTSNNIEVADTVFPDEYYMIHGGGKKDIPIKHRCGLLDVISCYGMPTIVLCSVYSKKTLLRFNLMCPDSINNSRNIVLMSYDFIKQQVV